jgi:hypothetical protein
MAWEKRGWGDEIGVGEILLRNRFVWRQAACGLPAYGSFE